MAGVLQSVEPGALLPGFFLRVTPQVTRSFGIVYTTREGRLRRCTLGPVGPLGLSDALALAKRLRGAVAQGEDPHGDRMIARRQPRTAATVATLVEAFLESVLEGWRPEAVGVDYSERSASTGSTLITRRAGR